MLLSYEQFFRHYTVRRFSQITTPQPNMAIDLKLPRGSVWHYFGDEKSEAIGPSPNHVFFSENNRPIMMSHVLDLTSTQGNPRQLAGNPQEAIRKYHQANRRIRKTEDILSGTRDIQVPYVVGYRLTGSKYKYLPNPMAKYNKWYNFMATVLDKANEIANGTEAHQYMFLPMPTRLPTVALLKQAQEKIDLTILKKLGYVDTFLVVELWKWLGLQRDTSIFSRLENKNLSKVNFIIQKNGQWVCLNLGALNSWRMTPDGEKTESKITKGLPPRKYQLVFLKFLMKLGMAFSVNPEAAAQLDEEAKAAEAKKANFTGNKPTDGKDTLDEIIEGEQSENKKDGVSSKGSNSGAGKTDETPDIVTVNEVNPQPVSKSDLLTNNSQVTQSSKAKLKDLDALDDLTEPETDSKGEFVVDDIDEAAMDEELSSVMPEEEPEATIMSKGKVVNLKANDDRTPQERFQAKVDELAEGTDMSAAEYKRYKTLSEQYKFTSMPGTEKTLEQAAICPKEAKTLKAPKPFRDQKGVFDKSMLHSSVSAFDRQYLEEVYNSDIAGCILGLQSAGICVSNIERETQTDITGTYDVLKIKVQPVVGTTSTLWVKLPVIDQDGNYKANGVNYRMRKQRGDMPIRKISPDKVSLTSYYGKVTVQRSVKKVTDYAYWLQNQVMLRGIDPDDETITEMKPANAFDKTAKVPRLYSTLAMSFQGFKMAGYDWNFDYSLRNTLFTVDEINTYERDGAVLAAKNDIGDLVVIDKDGHLQSVKQTKDVPMVMPLPDFEVLMGLDSAKIPTDITLVKVMGKFIPVGFLLAHHFGLDKLLSSLDATYRRETSGSHYDMQPDEFRLVFQDETILVTKDNPVACMILAGLNDFHKELKKYSVYDFDRKDVYFNLLEAVGLSNRYLREIELMFDMFVDHITHDVLVEMKEPTSFQGLLVRATELLCYDDHPDEVDRFYMRDKGFERIPGFLYAELVKSVRVQRGRVGRANVPIELNPYAVWRTINQDPAVVVANEINPVQDLKEAEAVTYSGTGGRSSQTMVKHTRKYHRNDLGTTSEATVDSSDVGVNVFLSTNPSITSVRGMNRPYDPETDGPSALFSTAFMMAPAADSDDPKRQNFVHIQRSHTVACDGYEVMPFRTGQEDVIANRNGSKFIARAKQDGTVTKIEGNLMTVTYKDGSTAAFDIGVQYGAAAGLTIPHELVANVKEGQKFKAEDILAYNKGFFEQNALDKTSVTYKDSLLCNVVVYETTLTDEDSCTITKDLAKKLKTSIAKPRHVKLDFDQVISNMVKVGDVVEPTDILCLIEDAVTANSDAFDKESLDTLRMVGSQAPTAKVNGIIQSIEVRYNGDKEDMSDSLRKLASAYDKQLATECKAKGIAPYTAAANEGLRINNQPVMMDTIVITFYIVSHIGMTIGDKVVFGNQGKSVVGEVKQVPITTEDGDVIDAEFGRRSIAARIVSSPDIIGTTTTLLGVIGKKAYEIYMK